MPQLYKYDNWYGLKIETGPKNKLKRWLYKRRPLYVGERPQLDFRIERLKQDAIELSKLIIVERQTGVEAVNIKTEFVYETRAMVVEGSTIGDYVRGEGDYQLMLQMPVEPGRVLRTALLTAFAINPDRKSYETRQLMLGVILGSILTIIVGIILAVFGIGA